MISSSAFFDQLFYIVGFVSNFFSSLVDLFVNFFSRLSNVFVDLFGSFVNIFINFFSLISSFIREIFSFHFKVEIGPLNKYSSAKALIDAVNNWILYYNNTRIQTKLNGHSPVEYRQLAA
ncbi:IS3 family transposase|uniref:IS3 family transposase n=1 Tax=Leuconostoc lactis TaxID=1246 RepID=A0A6L7A8M1_LEULA|nr:IS3 family transposase [Leuconostoc lactis]